MNQKTSSSSPICLKQLTNEPETNMTLIQVYRIGPTRQSVQKGFIVNGSNLRNDLLRLSRTSSPNLARIRLDSKRENVLWVDTGMVWLHTARAREEQFRLLSASIQE